MNRKFFYRSLAVLATAVAAIVLLAPLYSLCSCGTAAAQSTETQGFCKCSTKAASPKPFVRSSTRT